MTNSLAAIIAAGQSSIIKRDDTMFSQVAKSSDYFGRLQLCGSNSTLAKKKKITSGNYAYVVSDSDFADLSAEVDVLPLAWRPKALDMSGDNPLSVYDHNSAMFNEIKDRSETANSKCAYGPEFLVWIPKIKVFATLFFGSKSARPESKNLNVLLYTKEGDYNPRGATLKVDVAENKNYSWEVMTVFPCTTPFDLPDVEGVTKHVTKFENEAKAVAPEKAEQTGRAR